MSLPRWNAFATVYVALALCVLGASSTALSGGYVYDDQILPTHPMLDGWDDVGRALLRNSQDYLASASSTGVAKGVTYRPLPMASFALTQALVGSVPFAHHLVSLSFHLIALWFLTLYARSVAGRDTLGVGAIGSLTLFALHPATVEAYGWINGRSDAMAGAVLCALVWWLASDRPKGPALTLLLCVGCLCKETFLVASFALIVAFALTRSERPRARSPRIWLAWGAAVAVFFVLRAQTAFGGSSGLGLTSVTTAAVGAARVLLLGTKTLLLPWPEPMLLLASALAAPISGFEILAALIALGWLMRKVLQRDLRALLLVGGALVTLLPASLISGGFWLGFDRYLYMPLCLLFVAAAPFQLPLSARAEAWLMLPVALYLGAASFVEGGFYRSQQVFAEAMAQARPADPTGMLFLIQLAAARADAAEIRRLTAQLPCENLPATLLNRVIALKLSWGTKSEAVRLIAEGRRRFPDDPRFLRYAEAP